MNNISTLLRSVILFAGIGLSGCMDMFERRDLRYASKMQNFYNDTSSVVKTGGIKMIPISSPNGTYNVWTKTIGHSQQIKVLLLGTGPNLSHEYLQCLESYFPQNAISLVYYDPLGSGNSDNPSDTSFLSLSRQADQIEQLRSALNLGKNNFYLFGHGRGGMLAIEYALKYQQNLKALILSNTVSNLKVYHSYGRQLLSGGPTNKHRENNKNVKGLSGTEDLSDSQQLADIYSKHVCRLPQNHFSSETSRVLKNDLINGFVAESDSLKVAEASAAWDRSADLKQITVPTLLIGAKHDLVNPDHVKWMASQIKDADYIYCPDGSHLAMYDDQKIYMDGIIDFVYGVYRSDNVLDVYF